MQALEIASVGCVLSSIAN